MTLEMTPSCGKCGSNNLVGPDEMTDDSIITCECCGAENGTWGEVHAAAIDLAKQQAEEHIQAAFGKAFEGIDGLSFTKYPE